MGWGGKTHALRYVATNNVTDAFTHHTVVSNLRGIVSYTLPDHSFVAQLPIHREINVWCEAGEQRRDRNEGARVDEVTVALVREGYGFGIMKND